VPLHRGLLVSESRIEDGPLRRSSQVDQIARNVLALVAVIYLPSVGVRLSGELGRLDRGATTKDG
jgi:hypothetical protein